MFAHNFGSISRKANTMTHVLTFFIAMISACSYYAMWQGMGVIYKVCVLSVQYNLNFDNLVHVPLASAAHREALSLHAMSQRAPTPHMIF
jgi:hypothetical protein